MRITGMVCELHNRKIAIEASIDDLNTLKTKFEKEITRGETMPFNTKYIYITTAKSSRDEDFAHLFHKLVVVDTIVSKYSFMCADGVKKGIMLKLDDINEV